MIIEPSTCHSKECMGREEPMFSNKYYDDQYFGYWSTSASDTSPTVQFDNYDQPSY